MSEAIYVKDQETVIAISYPEMLKYHGRAYLAGVAMAFKLLELALSILAGEEIIPRDKISILLAVNGPGIIDGIEMVTRANTHGRLTVDQMISFEQGSAGCRICWKLTTVVPHVTAAQAPVRRRS
ncbi:MAG: hypothetical protein M1551_07760 [Firmicutes bacterium]|nr:hypothetical protein [Bacillota bacterium]